MVGRGKGVARNWIGCNELFPGADITGDRLEFSKAMYEFVKKNGYPTSRDILQVAYSLGYRKIEPPHVNDTGNRCGEGNSKPEEAIDNGESKTDT